MRRPKEEPEKVVPEWGNIMINEMKKLEQELGSLKKQNEDMRLQDEERKKKNKKKEAEAAAKKEAEFVAQQMALRKTSLEHQVCQPLYGSLSACLFMRIVSYNTR
jgi:lactate dehydrogenase-like 2-hydroxyacid dehydrogenase